MALSEDKQRFVVIINREVYEQLKMLATADGRSASNLAAKVLSDYVNKQQL